MVMNAEAREGRVDPRVTRTQKLIRDALRSLLSEKSFESTSVQDIAERATVNRATFYAHFTDKFALLDAIIREDIAAHLAQGDPLALADARAMLKAIAKNVFDFVGLHRKCKIDRDFEQQFERTMEAELAASLAPKFNACTARVVSSAIVGSAMAWRAAGAGKVPVDHVIDETVNVLADGVGRESRLSMELM
jgi:AcrR family transcriptional regulator